MSIIEELIGQSLGRYQIVNLLGKGGMGAVFQGRDATLKREVAIKVMHAQFAEQPDFRDRFLQEAQTAARLSHPGVVQVFDFGQEHGLLYIVMEFIRGDNLQQMLQTLWRNSQWLPLPEALQLIRQVCLAVDYAHHQGVLHRDLKPANIMLKADPIENLPYRPVLTDLGLAKLIEGGLETQEGTSMGTPAYMSPEQALGETTDARSDVYSLGILLYELTVGRLPFPIKTLTQAIRYHTKEPPPPPRSLRPDLPEALEQIILKTLAKQPADRLANAGALAEALAGVMPAMPAESVPPTALAGGVSLMTQYQESLMAERGPSLFPEVPADLSRDRLAILAEGQTNRLIQIKKRVLTIGRKADNDLALDDATVSSHHARVEFDGNNYKVTDLDSSNGTYLANVKLLPGIAELWTPDKVLRIGKHYLRLERGQAQPGQSTMVRRDGTIVEPNLMSLSPGEGRVAIFMEVKELSVEPGSSTMAGLTILNHSQVVDHFEVSVQGLPAEWVSLSPPAMQLMPGQQQEVALTIHPPRSPGSRARAYPLTIRAASQKSPDQVAELQKMLTVAAYQQFSSGLNPQQVQVGKTAVVTVQNQGNARQTFALKWQDRANELTFTPPQAQLTVVEGETATAEFQATLRQRRWLGGAKTHTISAQVGAPGAEVQSHSGEVISHGLIPLWLPPLLLFLCMALAAAAAFGYNQLMAQQKEATAAAQAAAATQTAMALAVDTDGDGLTDLEEAKLTTDPNLADTDGDGLNDKAEKDGGMNPIKSDTDGDDLADGEEIKWKSDPNAIDSDGDTLSDGEEVNKLKTSPVNVDTDSDGLNDNVDPDPGKLPTPTPNPTATPTGTATLIPTATSNAAATAQAATAIAQAAGNATAAAQATAQAQVAAQQTAAAAKASADAATAQAIENPPIDVRADRQEINEGECTTLRWIIQNVKEIYLNGDGIGGQGEQQVCPTTTTPYVWRIVKLNDKELTPSVTITVIPKPPQPVTINLTDYSSQARWEGAELTDSSGNARNAEDLPWMGDPGDDRGFVILGNTPLEDGSTKLALRTHPKWVSNGTIKGWHPWLEMPKNAVFEAQVGFVQGATGTDGVIFLIYEHHMENGSETWNRIAELSKGYTGSLSPIRADLSQFAGQQVSIELRVDAGPSSGQDWAVWVNPVITGTK